MKNFSSDPLVSAAKQRVWLLEMEATRRRLTAELGIPASADPMVQELEELGARLELTDLRAQEAERAAREGETKNEEYRRIA